MADIQSRHAVSVPHEALEVTESTTLGDLVEALNGVLREEGLIHLIGETDGLSVFPTLNLCRRESPGSWNSSSLIRHMNLVRLYSYACPGNNEGEYVHLCGLLDRHVLESRGCDLRQAERDLGAPCSIQVTLALGKGFGGLRGACEVSARINELLERWSW